MKYDEDDFADLRSSLRIDDCNLDIECSKQPGLYGYWSEKLAEAKAERDKKKEALKLKEAKKALEIRKSGEKVTEALVAQMVAADDDLYAMREELNETNKRVYALEGTVDALEHKRSQLGNLTQLYIKNHYQDARESIEKAEAYRVKSAKKTRGEE